MAFAARPPAPHRGDFALVDQPLRVVAMRARQHAEGCLRGARISVAMVAGIGLVMAIALFILASHHCVADEHREPSPAHGAQAWEAWGILLSSLILTGILTFYFLSSIEYARRMAALAGRLQEANQALEGEVASRRRIAEAMARESAKLSAMIAGMEEGVVFADAEDRIVEVNDYFLRFVGRERSELIGQPLGNVHPACMRDRVQQVLDDFRSRVAAKPHVIQRRVGEHEFLLRVQPIYRNGAYDGVLLNLVDVTELAVARRAAENASRQLLATNAELQEQLAAYAAAAGYVLPGSPSQAGSPAAAPAHM